MKTFTHVLITWLLSLPLMIIVIIFHERGTFVDFDSRSLLELIFSSEGIEIMVKVLVGTSPAFLAALAFFAVIQHTRFSKYEKMFLWYCAVCFAVALNAFLITVLLMPSVPPLQVLKDVWPAYVGACMAISLRTWWFLALVEPVDNTSKN